MNTVTKRNGSATRTDRSSSIGVTDSSSNGWEKGEQSHETDELHSFTMNNIIRFINGIQLFKLLYF